ncbi:MAG TPA: glycosyltransferase family 2 protein [Candidatus Saccharimonadales bacterium]|nr:glycosyltransferase family 2 protein [Candidatus Saccharimonadales bacterium]
MTQTIEDLTAVAVVIPCYRVAGKILGVIEGIPNFVEKIYVVDDCCPEKSGALVMSTVTDPRVVVIFNEANTGVGGAVMAGYRRAIADGVNIIVKMDGDGQMDPDGLMPLILPIVHGEADYTKGNRFFDLTNISRMPAIRIFGNACLSFMTKLSTGYWDIFDPTNGYTAIHASVAARLPFEKISRRYFFETDMLFRLGTYQAVVQDVPMDAKYDDEVSNLKISKIMGEFLIKHASTLLKRIFYTYYLRNVSLASLELPLGVLFMLVGIVFGAKHWWQSVHSGVAASAGTVMFPALLIIMGLQFVLSFIGYDIESVPRKAIFPSLVRRQSIGS